VIEIARAIHESNAKPKRSILFLAVTAEEKGLLGSEYFASHPTVKGTIVADLNMDMYLPLFPLKYLEVQGLGESTLGEDVIAVAKDAGVIVQADKQPDHVRFIRSDQYSFIKKGVPSLAFKFGWLPERRRNGSSTIGTRSAITESKTTSRNPWMLPLQLSSIQS